MHRLLCIDLLCLMRMKGREGLEFWSPFVQNCFPNGINSWPLNWKKHPQTHPDILSGRQGNNLGKNGSCVIAVVMVTKTVTVSTAVTMTSVVMVLVVTTDPGGCWAPLTDSSLVSKQRRPPAQGRDHICSSVLFLLLPHPVCLCICIGVCVSVCVSVCVFLRVCFCVWC